MTSDLPLSGEPLRRRRVHTEVMDTVLWILLGLTAWTVASFPLGVLVGRALRSPDSTPEPAPRGTTAPVLAA